MINRDGFYPQLTATLLETKPQMKLLVKSLNETIFSDIENAFQTAPEIDLNVSAEKIENEIIDLTSERAAKKSKNDPENDMIDVEIDMASLKEELKDYLNSEFLEKIHSLFLKIYPQLDDVEFQALLGFESREGLSYTNIHQRFDDLLFADYKQELFDLAKNIDTNARNFIASKAGELFEEAVAIAKAKKGIFSDSKS
jgi:hypothetical protein